MNSHLRGLAVLVLAMCVGAGWAFANEAGAAPASRMPEIDHIPVTAATAGRSVRLEAQINAFGRSLIYVRIYFRRPGESNFRFVDMRPGVEGYVGEIPARAVQPPGVQYFLIALLSDQSVMSFPSRNPYGQPFEIIVNEAGSQPESGAQPQPLRPAVPAREGLGKRPAKPDTAATPERISPQLHEKLRQMEALRAENSEDTASTPAAVLSLANPILPLSPEPFSKIPAEEDVLILASFAPEANIDSSSVRVKWNGKEVTGRANVSALLVSFDAGRLKAGTHRVSIVAHDASGRRIGPVSWQFEVAGRSPLAESGEEAGPRPVSGVTFAELRHEEFSGITLNNNNLGGNLNGAYGPLHFEASAYFTSLESRTVQPRNRFVLSAGTGWLNVTLGDATPYFNDLVLYGRRVRGVQAGLHTGIVNVEFVTGQTMRAISPVPGVLGGTYQQTLTAIRPSFGSRSFQFGLTLMKARDDTSSIAAVAATAAPRDNFVIGADVLMAFSRRRIELKAAVAQSFVTKDTRLPIISQSYVDSVYTDGSVELPFDPSGFKDWLILNESTTPLDPRGKTALAYQLGLRLNYFNQYFTLTLKQIGSEYNSFGHTYLRSDISGFSLYDRLRLLGNRVNLNFGLERFTDHYDNFDGKPQTALNAVQLGFLLNWNPNLPTVSFNLRNYNRDNGIDSVFAVQVITPNDTTERVTDLRQNNRTRDFSLTFSHNLQAFRYQHTVSLSLTNSDRIDRWANQRVAGFGGGDVTSDLTSITVRTKYHSPLMTTFNLAFNDNNVGGRQNQFNFTMFSGRADYEFPRQQLRTFVALRRVSASGQNGITGAPVVNLIKYTQTGLQLGGSLLLRQRHEVVVDLALIKYSDKGGLQTASGFTPRSPFTNSVVRAHYEFRF